MEKFLNKLERKYGRYAISNLSLYIIIAYVIGYILTLTGSVEFISLNPYQILHGQIWRIVTWIIVPPSTLNIFTIIMLFFYYSLGTSLERTWGTFRYNIYIFSGMLFTILGAFLLYVIYLLLGYPGEVVGMFISNAFSTYYINLSIFLAFAAVYPNMQVLLYFIIPVKIKWLAWLDVAVLLISFFTGNMGIKVAILASLLNFIIFFLGTVDIKRFTPKEVHRRTEFKKQTVSATPGYTTTDGKTAKHKCVICGRTELDGDHLEFRYCSKCNGNYEYCQDHLFTHEHR
ncbi:MAG: rhomboid family intramembrane serine protease [Lachnospiraceae bacterium]|nr:rhomboid family intramembrane serine protease [Lachnospiraceae bacterium]